ncbi:MAG: LPS export ABC transporter periplasmic protein LptC [Bacteroidota bacterium]|nr:LPS export ABC transporter periplasmic protein LptC [Bacteroidota bacterium]
MLSYVFRLTFLFVGCFLLVSCENDMEVVNNTNERKPSIEEAFNITSYLSANGQLRAKLTAPYMKRYTLDTSYLEFSRSLHVNFYDSAGKVESQVNALYGKYLESQSKVYLRDSVVAFNVKGDTLRTPDLWWDQNNKKFYTDKVVRFKSASKIIYGGKGFEADQDLSNYTIFKPTGIIMVPDSMAAQ